MVNRKLRFANPRLADWWIPWLPTAKRGGLSIAACCGKFVGCFSLEHTLDKNKNKNKDKGKGNKRGENVEPTAAGRQPTQFVQFRTWPLPFFCACFHFHWGVLCVVSVLCCVVLCYGVCLCVCVSVCLCCSHLHVPACDAVHWCVWWCPATRVFGDS